MKAAALLIGPLGVGLFGLYQNFVSVVATIFALGSGTVGTRQIAAAISKGEDTAVALAQRALFLGTLLLAALSIVLVVLARDFLAQYLLGTANRGAEIGWLALAVGLTIMAGSQTAMLNGLRKTADLARIQVASGLLSLVLGIVALLLWRERGIVTLVIAAPLASFLLGHWYVARLKLPRMPKPSLVALTAEWRGLARLGTAFMISSIALNIGLLASRTWIQNEAGLVALGQFQAAWMIGMTYLTFVLGAMVTDYYPRLTENIAHREIATRLINEQTEVALLLTGPIILAMLALSPWIIHILYSSEFAPAAAILRWQLLGDILKVMSWPLGIALLAGGAGKSLIATETAAAATFLVGTIAGFPTMGMTSTGVAFVMMYGVHLALCLAFARYNLGFRWTGAVRKHAIALLLAASAISIIGATSDMAACIAGLIIALGFGAKTVVHIAAMTETQGRLRRLVIIFNKIYKIFSRA